LLDIRNFCIIGLFMWLM